MTQICRALIAMACLLGAGAAVAQSVVRDGKEVGTADRRVAQAARPAPVLVAQAGGTSRGAQTAGVAGATAGGMATLVAIATAVAVAAISVDSGNAATQH